MAKFGPLHNDSLELLYSDGKFQAFFLFTLIYIDFQSVSVC